MGPRCRHCGSKYCRVPSCRSGPAHQRSPPPPDRSRPPRRSCSNSLLSALSTRIGHSPRTSPDVRNRPLADMRRFDHSYSMSALRFMPAICAALFASDGPRQTNYAQGLSIHPRAIIVDGWPPTTAVFFERGSARIDRIARKVLRRFVEQAESFDTTYSLCSRTDVTDGEARGEDLRRDRKVAVADTLSSLGMERSRLIGQDCEPQPAGEAGARSRAVFIR